MANEKWETATVEQKLELLRHDIMRIRDAQNGLAREFRDEVRPLAEAIVRIDAELRRNLPPSEVAQPSTPSQTLQAEPSVDRTDA